MTRNDGYASPGAVESAISAAARKASNTDPSLTIQERIRLEYFHRFLSRVFSEENDSNWMLKGGAGMLARVASARTTTDVDVFRRSASLDAALVVNIITTDVVDIRLPAKTLLTFRDCQATRIASIPLSIRWRTRYARRSPSTADAHQAARRISSILSCWPSPKMSALRDSVAR